jgi:hypothetical protein
MRFQVKVGVWEFLSPSYFEQFSDMLCSIYEKETVSPGDKATTD